MSIRPHVPKMLKILKSDFEMIVFTAGAPQYAKEAIKIIEQECGIQIFDHVLS